MRTRFHGESLSHDVSSRAKTPPYRPAYEITYVIQYNMTAGGNGSWAYVSSDLIAPRIHAETRKNAPICSSRAMIGLNLSKDRNSNLSRNFSNLLLLPQNYLEFSVIKILEYTNIFIRNMNINPNPNEI